jgi:hypothetical protein
VIVEKGRLDGPQTRRLIPVVLVPQGGVFRAYTGVVVPRA